MTTKTPPRIYMSIPPAAEYLSVSDDYMRNLYSKRPVTIEVAS